MYLNSEIVKILKIIWSVITWLSQIY